MPVPLPGFVVNGLMRVDPTAFQLLGLTGTNGVDAPTMPLAVRATPALLGNQLDCPSFPIGRTAVVDGYPANAFGVHDLHCNVAEWCLDSFVAYTAAPAVDPFAPGGFNPPVRGGTWSSGNGASSCRSASRFGYTGGLSVPELGFRYVLAPIGTP
ncbi:MAG: formylglycine-generating enzyme family protein [Planctomycetota bacterium]